MASKPKRSRTLLDKVLRRPPPPPPPNPMRFLSERRAAEERQAAEEREAQQQKEAARQAERPKSPQPPTPPPHPVIKAMAPKATITSAEFDKAAQTSRRITQQVFDSRFRSETARANALDAMEEAKRRREVNDQTFAEAVAKQSQMIDRLNGRPVWGEAGKAINDIVTQAWDAHEQEKRTIEFDLNMLLSEAERLNPPGKGFKKPGPRLQLTGPEPDSTEPFNRAATATPDWRSIFYTAVEKGVTIEAARAELEPAVEPSMGQDGTPPEGGWPAYFNEVARNQPAPEPGIGIDR